MPGGGQSTSQNGVQKDQDDDLIVPRKKNEFIEIGMKSEIYTSGGGGISRICHTNDYDFQGNFSFSPRLSSNRT